MRLEAVFFAQAWAAPSTGAEAHGASWTQVFFPVINFLIFLYLVKRFLLPVIKDHLRSRRDEIVAALKEADEARRRAEAMVRDYRGRVARIEDEKRKIREELRTDGEREKVKLLRETTELASRIKADAGFLAEQEVKLARQRVREEIARQAEVAAAQVIERHLTSSDQKRLVEEFLSGVASAS